jgi:hypothetical protein
MVDRVSSLPATRFGSTPNNYNGPLQRQMVSRDSKQERLLAHISALVSLDVKEQLAPSYCSGLRMVRGRGFEPLTPTVSR